MVTTIILFGLAAITFFLWPLFFTEFHEPLFPPNTWRFDPNDSLIRLFPEILWFNVGITLTSRTFIAGLIVTLLGFLLSKIPPVGGVHHA